MDSKLRVIQELLDEIGTLNELTPSTCTKSAQAQNIGDDIIHKLILIRKMLSNSTSPLSPNFMTTYALLNGDISPSSPTSSRKSSSLSGSRYLLTHTVLNDEEHADPREVARSAYDADNYAKCIRTIEKLLALEGHTLDCEMMSLCHDSYKKIVEDAVTENERFKLCEWWRLFLDSVNLSSPSTDAQLQLIDCKTDCLWERQRQARTDSDNLRYIEQLMNANIEAYELTAVSFRPFHIKCLRRVQKICALIVGYFEQFPDCGCVPLCIDEGIELTRYATDEAKVDAVAYAKETDASFQDLYYLECIELIKEIEMVISDIGYGDLATPSDSDSYELASSDDGHDHDCSKSDDSVLHCTQKITHRTLSEHIDVEDDCVTRL